ncbi:tripartite tricarboxylate transporter permease [Rhizobium wenxiniae]|uniref:tripartite tricarboxylate transporter permease n=1 Tax=Rhizobium wenxiniae TaxID=1737357 RepID=UPI001C6E99C0|nr:tripartite tricarboxylate transporter permease [Rhizobium wenxiniae]MBW9089321.1 tripartite tricarboxylate transporter permease [Rhizobium wenxiniae]
MNAFVEALSLVFNLETLLVILASAIFGLFVGALPGLTATMATALLVPLTFYMAPIPAIAAIIASTAMAITAGDLPGTLLRIPGTPASAAYVEDSYRMAQKGQAGLAIGIGVIGSVLGGLFGFVFLMFTAPALAKFALGFSSFEYFWLAVLGLSCAALISSGGVAKGGLSLLLGLLIAQVGVDPLTGTPRFTFGVSELTGGISFIPAMIGMFALAEVMRTGRRFRLGVPQANVRNPFKGVLACLWKYRKNQIRGSVIGSLIGALPGVGGDLAAWVTYSLAKKTSKTPELFGKGHPEGLVEAGATNNAALSSSWIPAMVFGIPGDAVTAIAVGVLVMKGMEPGPQLLTSNPQNFYAVMLVFVIANILMLPLGYIAARSARRIFEVPRALLNAAILLFCIVGSYSINNTMFGVTIMLALGVIAFFLEKSGFAIAPIILGIVLGPLVEQNFTTSMIITNGNVLGLFERPISAVLGIATIAVWSLFIFGSVKKTFRPKEIAGETL